jgi:hypothetical protein
MSSFAIGRDYSKQEKKKRAEVRKKKKVHRYIFNESTKRYEPLFLRTWFLYPLNKGMESLLICPSLSFTQRYKAIDAWDEKNHPLEESFLKALGKQRITKTDLFSLYQRNQKLRWTFKKLVLQWKLKRLEMMNETDIITFEEPRQKIYVYDFQNKKQYQFEARPFLIDCVNRLLLHSDFFPEAKVPRNLLTNQDLTWNQLWSISNQFKQKGVSHWIWEAFVRTQFCLLDLFLCFETPLKYEMVDRCFHDSTQKDANWYVSEFIANHTEGGLTSFLKWGVYRLPNDAYIKEWKDLCYRFWKIAVVKGEEVAEGHPCIVSGIVRLLEDKRSILEIRKAFRKENPL